jgi:hypothetical protein
LAYLAAGKKDSGRPNYQACHDKFIEHGIFEPKIIQFMARDEINNHTNTIKLHLLETAAIIISGAFETSGH